MKTHQIDLAGIVAEHGIKYIWIIAEKTYRYENVKWAIKRLSNYKGRFFLFINGQTLNIRHNPKTHNHDDYTDCPF